MDHEPPREKSRPARSDSHAEPRHLGNNGNPVASRPDHLTRKAEALATTAEAKAGEAVDRASFESARQMMGLLERSAALSERATAAGDDSRDRVVRRRLIVLVTLVVTGLSIAAFIASPLLFPLSVLIACLGVLADRHLPRRAPPEHPPPNPPDSG
jgi:hypothetical protein